MSNEGAKEIITETSSHDIDHWARTESFRWDIEESIHGHIHQKLTSWLFFRKLAADCSRSNISLHGFARLWERSAAECLADYKWLDKYVVSRGGRSTPTAIGSTPLDWPDGPVELVGPFEEAVLVQKRLLEDLQRLCSSADKSGDSALADAIRSNFMCKEMKHAECLADILHQVVRPSKQPGLGLHLLDRKLRHTDGIVPSDLFKELSQQHDNITGNKNI